jgi:hypothetical protein
MKYQGYVTFKILFQELAGLKKQGAGLAACPLKNLLYHYLHSENSSSWP